MRATRFSSFFDEYIGEEPVILSMSFLFVSIALGITVSNEYVQYRSYIPYFVLLGCYGSISVVWTLSFVIASTRRKESIIEWPYKKFWPYPTILFLLWPLLPCFAIKGIIAIAKKAADHCVNVIMRYHHEESAMSEEDTLHSEIASKMNRDTQLSAEEIPEPVKFAMENFSTIKERITYELTDLEETFSKEVRGRQGILQDLGNKIRHAQDELAVATKRLERWQNISRANANEGRTLYSELVKTLKLKHIVAVDLEEDHCLVGYTDMVFIADKGKTYKIGMFEIKIHLVSRDIEIYNLTSTHRLREAHLFSRTGDGSFCFGTLQCDIDHALAHFEIAAAFEYIVLALHSAKGREEMLPEWEEVESDVV